MLFLKTTRKKHIKYEIVLGEELTGAYNIMSQLPSYLCFFLSITGNPLESKSTEIQKVKTLKIRGFFSTFG